MLHTSRDVVRLVDRAGRQVGEQEFLPTWGPTDVVWMWNADRTRVFVLPKDAGSPLALRDGTYRMDWRFVLDLSPVDKAAPILRRRGLTADEEAVMQFTLRSA
jgi:hypothetical protein